MEFSYFYSTIDMYLSFLQLPFPYSSSPSLFILLSSRINKYSLMLIVDMLFHLAFIIYLTPSSPMLQLSELPTSYLYREFTARLSMFGLVTLLPILLASD